MILKSSRQFRFYNLKLVLLLVLVLESLTLIIYKDWSHIWLLSLVKNTLKNYKFISLFTGVILTQSYSGGLIKLKISINTLVLILNLLKLIVKIMMMIDFAKKHLLLKSYQKYLIIRLLRLEKFYAKVVLLKVQVFFKILRKRLLSNLKVITLNLSQR